ncbi:MAG: type II toxin-antitoxin system VapB family antitoxin [Rhizobiaceae bacterium]|nr:type II toxin-antitoxin system VapB family antitoxin [Rhizobiaceae bacterium]
MALNLRNRETERLVREYARQRGLGLTEAVHEAVESALKSEEVVDKTPGEALLERLQPLFDRLDRLPRTGQKADKAFFDDLWGQGDD